MQTSTAVEEIRARLGELAEDFWKDEEVLRALNAACVRFAMEEKWEWLWTVGSDTLSAGDTRFYLSQGTSANRHFFLQGTFSGDPRPYTPRRVTTAEGIRLRARYYTPGQFPLVYFLYEENDGVANELETITNAGSTSGTFTLTFDGQTTATISRGATASAIQAALVALSNIGPADVRVYGGALGTAAVYVEFRGQYAGVDVPTLVLGGTTTSMSVATPNVGGNPSSQMVPTLELLPELTRDFSFDVTYLRIPRVLSADADIIDIPEEYIDAVIAKATERLWLKELRDSGKADEQRGQYLEVLDQARRDQRKLLPDEGFAWGKDEPQTGFESESHYAYRHFSGPLG